MVAAKAPSTDSACMAAENGGNGDDSRRPSAVADGPVLTVLAKRLRALRKKLDKIGRIEAAQAEGKPLNEEQLVTVRSRVAVEALIEEYERLKQPLTVAVSEEQALFTAALAAEKEVEESAASDNRESGDADEKAAGLAEEAADVAKAEVPAEGVLADGVEGILQLLYFGKLFRHSKEGEVGFVEKDAWKQLIESRQHAEGAVVGESCVDVDAVVDATRLLLEREGDTVSHADALRRLVAAGRDWTSLLAQAQQGSALSGVVSADGESAKEMSNSAVVVAAMLANHDFMQRVPDWAAVDVISVPSVGQPQLFQEQQEQTVAADLSSGQGFGSGAVQTEDSSAAVSSGNLQDALIPSPPASASFSLGAPPAVGSLSPVNASGSAQIAAANHGIATYAPTYDTFVPPQGGLVQTGSPGSSNNASQQQQGQQPAIQQMVGANGAIPPIPPYLLAHRPGAMAGMPPIPPYGMGMDEEGAAAAMLAQPFYPPPHLTMQPPHAFFPGQAYMHGPAMVPGGDGVAQTQYGQYVGEPQHTNGEAVSGKTDSMGSASGGGIASVTPRVGGSNDKWAAPVNGGLAAPSPNASVQANVGVGNNMPYGGRPNRGGGYYGGGGNGGGAPGGAGGGGGGGRGGGRNHGRHGGRTGPRANNNGNMNAAGSGGNNGAGIGVGQSGMGNNGALGQDGVQASGMGGRNPRFNDGAAVAGGGMGGGNNAGGGGRNHHGNGHNKGAYRQNYRRNGPNNNGAMHQNGDLDPNGSIGQGGVRQNGVGPGALQQHQVMPPMAKYQAPVANDAMVGGDQALGQPGALGGA